MLIVQLCAFGHDGDALYRVHEPAQALARLPGVTFVDAHLSGRHGFALAQRADVLILHFANDWGLADLVRLRRAAGRPTVFEANDDFFDLQPWNPIARVWADPSVPALYRHLLRAADGVQTSTGHLASRWRAMGAREVAVFDNHLAEPPPPITPARTGPLTIGWAGSPGHLGDLYWVAPTLTRWLVQHLDVRLAIMTAESARGFFALPAERYRFVPFGPRADYLSFLESLDIGLAPLLPTPYNRGRSDVKHLEYASRGVVGLYSDLEPYRGRVEPEGTGLLFDDLSGLCAGLDRLCGDPDLRIRLRARAHQAVGDRRQLDAHAPARLAWYARLAAAMNPSDGSARQPLSGYHAVDLGPGEAMLARHDSDDAPMTAELDRLLAAAPDHRAAALRRARIHLRARQTEAGLSVLNAALTAHPEDTELGAELGRALYLADDTDGARFQLETILVTEPGSLPAWRYRLRLASLTQEPAGPDLAARAVATLPASGAIALLAAELLPPSTRLAALRTALAQHESTLSEPERPGFADQLAAAIGGLVGASELERCALLRSGRTAFPHCAALASLLGQTLRRLGAERDGLLEEARALALDRKSVV